MTRNLNQAYQQDSEESTERQGASTSNAAQPRAVSSKKRHIIDNEESQPKRYKPVDKNQTMRELIELFLRRNFSLNVANVMKQMEIFQRDFAANNLIFNASVFKEYILSSADGETGIYKQIANEVQDKFPSLVFNSASRQENHRFSVSLRFADGPELIERTIGFIEQNKQQTAWDLFEKIDELLNRVGLSFNDIYSTCNDQGANILRATDLNLEAKAAIKFYRGMTLISQEEEREELDQDNAIIQAEREVDHEEDERLRQQEQVEQVEITVADVIAEEVTLCTKTIYGVQTCQFAAMEVIKDFEAVIDEIAVVVNASIRFVVAKGKQAAGITMLLKDTEKNFCSLFRMINDVNNHRIKLEEIALTEERIKLSEDAWKFITEFIQVFTPVNSAIEDFQREDITISQFYIRWELMGIVIRNVPEGQKQLKTKLLESLQRHKQQFFESDAFVAALLLDPRINWSQNPEDFFNPALYERGMLELEKVHQAITNRNQEDQGVQEIQQDEEALNQLLGGGRRYRIPAGQNPYTYRTIRERVNFFLAQRRLSSANQISPINYWYEKREKEPLIYEVSQVVYGAAFSQVKVKREFNGFALVLPLLKTLLDDETLNTVFVVKNNLDLLNNVKFF